jgi:hypothetical protein
VISEETFSDNMLQPTNLQIGDNSLLGTGYHQQHHMLPNCEYVIALSVKKYWYSDMVSANLTYILIFSISIFYLAHTKL